jgi:hypothetical protein
VTVTQTRLKELLEYDPETGIFRWRIKPSNRVRVGQIAGNLDTYGNRQIRIDNKSYLAHRLAVLYVTGSWPTEDIGHRDLDNDNNAWGNLWQATWAPLP